MTLENLVPPIDLCKQIPAGHFEDSALVWVLDKELDFVYARELVEVEDPMPAPTLAEVLREMALYPNLFRMMTVEVDKPEETTVVAEFQNFPYNGKPGGVLHEEKDENGATAALKLWLDLIVKEKNA